MNISDFDFELPKEKIAVRPVEPRDSAKMLCVNGDKLEDKIFSDILGLLNPEDCLVLNDTKVIPVRITGKRDNVNIEATLHKMYDDKSWWAFAKPGKRLKVGDIVNFSKNNNYSSLAGESNPQSGFGEGKNKDIQYKRREYRKELKSIARNLRKDSTLQEGLMWRILKNYQTGYKFRRQFNIDNRYIADFICLEKRLVIEIDGGQHIDNEKDLERTKYLEKQEFKVIRFWNNDILENIEGVYDKIIGELDNTSSPKSKISTLPQGESEAHKSVNLDSFARDSDFFAVVKAKDEDNGVLFEFNKAGNDLMKALEDNGVMPLPPYIERLQGSDKQDASDYQTVFAKNGGAVAAPTAGLHFTEELLQKIKDKGVKIVYVTLHVGAGTFLPVKVENIKDHVMHSEYGEITQEQADSINNVKQNGGSIVAVGTTSLRLLESAVDDNGVIHPFAQETDIFITPGYKFKAIDKMITNFHLPKSTLFMLVSALAGTDNMKKAYEYAKNNGYRFYSYGDACFLNKKLLNA